MNYLSNLFKVLILICTLALININCKNKTSKITTPPTVESISGIYTITGAKLTSDGTEKDIYPGLNECQKNNTYGFNKDMVWYLGGVAKQDCTGPDESGTWALNGNILTVNSQQSGNYQYTIINFDGKVLVTESTADNNGKKETMLTTFTKK